ncbi:MAG TPA: NUDIX domain-containing protein [Pseudonocardiaceae bacterium]|nr:NUDIX domain-containing protein [Pseudonocardiaceae bacterium]
MSSVRCLVVCCQNEGGSHPWPGGKREADESFVDTAVREVHEETGWLLEPDSVRPLGWPHLEHLAPRRPGDHHLPYPDLLQVVLCLSATERDVDWTDTDGYETRSLLLSVAQAREGADTHRLAHVFLDLL